MRRAPKACPKCHRIQPCPQHAPAPWADKRPWHSRGVSAAQRQRILRRDDYTCRTCGHRDRSGHTLHVDHDTQVAHGGTDDDSNLRTLCTACHLRKSAAERSAARWANRAGG